MFYTGAMVSPRTEKWRGGGARGAEEIWRQILNSVWLVDCVYGCFFENYEIFLGNYLGILEGE